MASPIVRLDACYPQMLKLFAAGPLFPGAFSDDWANKQDSNEYFEVMARDVDRTTIFSRQYNRSEVQQKWQSDVEFPSYLQGNLEGEAFLALKQQLNQILLKPDFLNQIRPKLLNCNQSYNQYQHLAHQRNVSLAISLVSTGLAITAAILIATSVVAPPLGLLAILITGIAVGLTLLANWCITAYKSHQTHKAYQTAKAEAEVAQHYLATNDRQNAAELGDLAESGLAFFNQQKISAIAKDDQDVKVAPDECPGDNAGIGF